MRFWGIAIVCLAQFSFHASADTSTSWRALNTLVGFEQLSETEKKNLELIDLMAFDEANARYVGIGGGFVRNFYAGTAHRNNSIFLFNDSMLRNFTYGGVFRVANEVGRANVLVFGVEDVLSEDWKTGGEELLQFFHRDVPGDLFDSMRWLDEGRCGLYRETEANESVRTLIIINIHPDPSINDLEARTAAISCVNRGHYYHLGFSNAVNLDSARFVDYRPKGGRLWLNMKFHPLFPQRLRKGELLGWKREAVLSGLIKAAITDGR
ncbi:MULTISPECIES: hypothetical protein [Kordiimonas]|jgi:hypothetical protein|uniref:hypothetical protein n=1 Tax=Kordiimonas TaxID=288021 RepID=UPI00257B081E|nr:hypothetical protein [Kordiimonas sp. UBA4487]